MAIERLTQLCAKSTAADTASQPAEDGTRYRTEGDTDRANDSANKRARLASSQPSTTHDADGRADFHGMMERSDLGGMTARALQ